MIRVDVGKFNSILTSDLLESAFDSKTSTESFGILNFDGKTIVFSSIFSDIDLLLECDSVPVFMSDMSRRKRKSLPINHIVGVRLEPYVKQWKV
jgi:hypothetical protein